MDEIAEWLATQAKYDERQLDDQDMAQRALAELQRVRAELDENVGVMNLLRRHRDNAERKLDQVRELAERYDAVPGHVPLAGEILAVLDGEQ